MPASPRKTPALAGSKLRQVLREQLIARLSADVEAVELSQKVTQAGAVHEESRPENDKDTRALESTYLARGLAKRVAELNRSLSALRSWNPGDNSPHSRVGLASLLRLDSEEEANDSNWIFVAPSGGGIEIKLEDRRWKIVTPKSPLGQALMGKELDDEIVVNLPAGQRDWVLTWLN